MELRQLEHFLAVAKEQHFTRAASALQISQSGLSASIRALESELGSPLFTRSTRRVELTPAGRAMLAESEQSVASALAARDAVLAVQGVLRGSLAVGTEECLGGVHLPRELATFREQHPGVGLRLTHDGSGTLLDAVGSGRLDLALVADIGAVPAGVVTRPLASEGFAVLAHPEHPLADRPVCRIPDLEGQTIVGLQEHWGASHLAAQAFAAHGLAFEVELEVNDVHTLLDLVEYGMGVAVVPAHFAEKRPAGLRAVPLEDPLLVWRTMVALPERPTAAARAFVAALPAAAAAR
ncbi:MULTISPECIES: LysR family transcriptional regulator [unclassified Rathayibacter]|uniref:LysR family transcriptional regulator n=1 Tax=unclassified Rathayibacter TaxID=2609250 RepID=UPI000F4BC9D5|nr:MULTISPECIES: LysR family transcriptional regulator [unclassified Rathayibacter]MCJ1703038.1 LysR family transcriptional regulator [Rathayibacter sp. VKM Ac-2926]ROP49490.1 DNA-binding transcriptional LysR family regulator [Rathayibacter sp. PhB186]ROS52016.1 DNA-binding transcriptional LysR family regulator [Rathayibacter sp. PhB185]TCL82273.1 DNA-binding transcriptional LysR family regulator [Rathayibacter sp. PhB192]TCM27489.1 DNA-binding transcriptional LysR family regulator [Rathayibac